MAMSCRLLRTSASNYQSPKTFPYFDNHAEIGMFSLDEERQFHNDRRSLKDLCPPDDLNHCNFNLRDGVDSMVHADDARNTEYLNKQLRWIMENKDQHIANKEGEKIRSLSQDFVCRRGLLAKVLSVPYERKDDVLLVVIKFRGTYYMCAFDTLSQKLSKMRMDEKDKEMSCWGWKFEQYVTAKKGSAGPDTTEVVNCLECVYTVVCSKLNGHSLIFSGEVDCEDLKSPEKNKYVELKTNRLIEYPKQKENFNRFKLFKWWTQSILLGTPTIVCGFRNDNGVVRKLQEFKVKSLPDLARGLRDPWRPNVCFNFLEAFLGFVKSNVTEDNEGVAHVFRRESGGDFKYEGISSEEEHKFLPEWYTSWDAWSKME